MAKAAIIVLADTEGLGNLGRVVNAMMSVTEFMEAGDEVALVFDGAGVKWVGALDDKDHPYHDLWFKVKDKVRGACSYCADAFKVADAVKAADIPLTDDYKGHPSLRQFVSDGYAVITF